jgi:cell division septum initiation protein DivIVA
MITVDILYLVDRLEELLNTGTRVPLLSKTMVNEDEILDIIDQMRIALPEEVKQARKTQQDRDRLLAQGHEEAERVLGLAKQEAAKILGDARDEADRVQKGAKEEAARLVNEHALTKAATDRIARLEQDAKAAAMQTRQGADTYASEVLIDLKARLELMSKQVLVLQQQVDNGLGYIIKQSANPEFESKTETGASTETPSS